MQFKYESQGNDSVLVYQLGENEHLDHFAKEMMQNNEMNGILQPAFMQHDRDQYLKYPVTSKIPLADFFVGEVKRDTVLRILMSFAGAVKEVEDYMLDTGKLLLDPNYIFVDIRKKEVGMVYVPIDEFSQAVDMKEFLLSLLSHLYFSVDGEISYVAKLFHFLNRPDAWEIGAFKNYLEQIAVQKEIQKQETQNKELKKIVSAVREPDRSFESGPIMSGGENGQNFSQAQAVSEVKPVKPVSESVGRPVEIAPEMGMPMVPNIPGMSEKTNEKKEKHKISLFGKKEKVEKVNAEPETEKAPEKKKGLFGRSKKKEEKAVITPVVAPWDQPEVPPIPTPNGNISVDHGKAEGKEETKPSFLQKFSKPKQGKEAVKKTMEVPEEVVVKPSVNFRAENPVEQRNMVEPVNISKPLESKASIQHLPSDSMETVYVEQGSSEDADHTVIMGGEQSSNATVLMGAENRNIKSAEPVRSYSSARIIRRKTGQTMVLNQDSLRIGSEGSFVDFYISDNPLIGACHADITKKGGKWYITDRSSANHTYVDGVKIPPMQATEIKDGTIFRLADEEFEMIIS